jgi:ubiquitin thioesterase OTU1
MFAYNGAVFVANELKKKNQFTDKANFSIKCGVCKHSKTFLFIGYECFKGEKEAVAHAQETGHSNFQEC